MKYGESIKFLVLALCVFTLAGCRSSQISDVSNQANQNQAEHQQEIISVPDICELMRNYQNYHQKTIKVKSTIYSLFGTPTLGDEKCVPRHPLFDVGFTEGFESSVCNSAEEDDKKEKLCLIARATRQGKHDIDFAIELADMVGYFEYYSSKEGFITTLAGDRLRFIVERIENAEDRGSSS